MQLASVYGNGAVGADGFFAVCKRGGDNRSVFYRKCILTPEGVAVVGYAGKHSGADDADVVVGSDAGLAVGHKGQRTGAAEYQLAFAEKGGLEVFAVRSVGIVAGREQRSVIHCIHAVQYYESAFVALIVDYGAAAVQVQPFQHKRLFAEAV